MQPRKPTYYVVSNPYTRQDQGDAVLRLLFAGHSQTEPGHQNGPKVFDYFLIHQIISGKGVYTRDDRTFELTEGDSFFIEPGKLVSYRADEQEPWQYRWIAVQGNQASELISSGGIDWGEPVVRGAGRHPAGRWIEEIETVLRKARTGGELRARGLFHLLMADIAERTGPAAHPAAASQSRIEQHVRQAVQQLTTQYAEPIRIESLAEAYGYNRAYFSKMFKSFNRVSPVTFLLHLRLGKARQLLRERPELTVEQIAYSVGFQDPLYLSRQFKRYYGVSPSAYRKSLEHLRDNEL